ncbi:MAG: AmmeMemoRadiSam system radical SAM enzyme [Promethearchaeota archaeon]|jgi:pyruvate formate lyase activating enzyme
MNSEFIKKSKYQRIIDENYSQCLTCERKCKILKGKSGYCQTRINKDGVIFTIVYGLIPALSINPIEKKPLYHFHPGSKALTVGTYGCNFSCFWCQNHHISKRNASKLDLSAISQDFLSPKKFIDIALMNNCEGTSISFNEPTLLFEFSLEVFKLAKKKSLYNTYVTNGNMTEEVLKDLVDSGLNAMNIDIKGDSEMVQKYCGADMEHVWRNARNAKEMGVHIELTTLIIENLNTKNGIIRKVAEKISNELGDSTPYHISRFFPHYESYNHGLNEPTPLKYLYNAHDIVKSVGLKYVYLGNLPNNDCNNTVCPKCSKLVIKRNKLSIQELNLDINGNCKYCGFQICVV